MNKTIRLGRLFKVGLVVLLVFASIVFLLSLGTIFYQIPILGSFANIMTITILDSWLIINIVITIFSVCALALCLAFKKRKTLSIIALGLIVSSLIITIIFSCIITSSIRSYGIKSPFTTTVINTSDISVKTETYTSSNKGNVELDVYYNDDETLDKPVVIYIHGGGWISGDKNNHSYYSKVFAKNGYIAYSLNYDLSDKDNHLVATTELQLLDGIAYVKNNAHKYNGNANRIYLIGDSAGGNLALELAYKIANGIYTESSDGSSLPQIKAVSVLYPATNPEDMYNHKDLITGKAVSNMAYYYTGCTPSDNKNMYDSINPINYITTNTPPTNIILGNADSTITPKSTYGFIEKLKEQNVDYNAIIIPFANHSFDNIDGTMLTNAFLESTLKWFDTYK